MSDTKQIFEGIDLKEDEEIFEESLEELSNGRGEDEDD